MLKERLKEDSTLLKTKVQFTVDSALKVILEIDARQGTYPGWIKATTIETTQHQTIDLIKNFHTIQREGYQAHAINFWQDSNNHTALMSPTSLAYAKKKFADVLRGSMDDEARIQIDHALSFNPSLQNDGSLIWLFYSQTVFPNRQILRDTIIMHVKKLTLSSVDNNIHAYTQKLQQFRLFQDDIDCEQECLTSLIKTMTHHPDPTVQQLFTQQT
jgi:hypothetical protein